MNVHAEWQFDSRFDDEFYRGVIVDNATGAITSRTHEAFSTTTDAYNAAHELIVELVAA